MTDDDRRKMRYQVYIIDAFTGHILHPDGSDRAQRVGDIGFHEDFESREEALCRKDHLLSQPHITEVSVISEDKTEALVFQNESLIQAMIAERKIPYKKQPIQLITDNDGTAPSRV